MSNIFGGDDLVPIQHGVSYNPDTGNYNYGVHSIKNNNKNTNNNNYQNPNSSINSNSPDISNNEIYNPRIKNSITEKMNSASCFQCQSTASSSITGGDCNDILACISPDSQNERSWFKLNCMIRCPETKPFCYSHKYFVNGDLTHVDRGCTDVDDGYKTASENSRQKKQRKVLR